MVLLMALSDYVGGIGIWMLWRDRIGLDSRKKNLQYLMNYDKRNQFVEW